MENIANTSIYLTKMSKTFFDKAWFMSHLPESIDTIIDFGCADGSFMKFLKLNCPAITYIGIDNSLEFKQKTIDNGFECYESLEELKQRNPSINPNFTCLILSSVLHEIYSYTNADNFWKSVNDSKIKYIAIRDMIGINKGCYYSLDEEYITKLFKKYYPILTKDFMSIYGKFNTSEKVIHFLLKYIYNNENWKREVKENYLPVNKQLLYNKIKELNYTIEYEEYYKLPYLMNRWKNDFELYKNNNGQVALNHFINFITTHYKMLLKRG